MAPRSSYGSIKVDPDDTEEWAPLVVETESVYAGKKKKYGYIAGLSVIGLAVASLGYWKMNSKSNQANAPTNPWQSHEESNTFEEGDTLLLSKQSPVDMGFESIVRAEDALPSSIWGNRTGPLPTNAWYLNLVSQKAASQPDDATRAYTVPYIIDTAPPQTMAGIRVHWPVLSAGANNIQMVDDFKNSLCLGSKDIEKSYHVNPNEELSHLGVSLLWSQAKEDSASKSMGTHIVRGMPFTTMVYNGGALPTLYSYNGPASTDTAILADGHKKIQCGKLNSDGSTGSEGSVVSVKKEMSLHFINSDFTWGLYFSKPVKVRCDVTEGDEKTREFQLSVLSYEVDEEPLIVQVALLDGCTTGQSNIKAHCQAKKQGEQDLEKYANTLKEGTFTYPTTSHIHFEYPEEGSEDRKAVMTIDWGAQSLSDESQLLMYALPHHQEQLSLSDDAVITDQCFQTFHGNTCLVKGNVWTMEEDLGSPMSFTAPRPPTVEAMPTLASTLADDIQYRLSDNTLRAASDTYFSGKVLARLARVIVIAAEMNALASGDLESLNYDDADEADLFLASSAAAAENFPTEDAIADAVENLKQGVQVWLSKDAEAPFVFDESWGGLVNCGCRYSGKDAFGFCNNTFPDCPALADVNEDFGNGYYNDHHYHYGYHVYAAAVVAKYDPEWAAEYFEEVLLYIRDFANPSTADEFFTPFRQKDWFLGSSWASGIVSAENSPHGRNEESSSEAIAAYEGMALYGAVMADLFSASGDDDSFNTAKLVRDAGQLLTATELRATNRYWHVWSSDDHTNTYPATYKQAVVGMVYDTMASFQTWFAPWAVVSYGIQLMPFTPVSEQRDDPKWAAELYPQYVKACEAAGDFCTDNGWSILQAGLCAEVGDYEEAMEQALSIPTKVFNSLGGMGNSLSNTIWFISTRGANSATGTSTNSTESLP